MLTASSSHIMLNLILVIYLFKIAHLFNPTVASHEEKSFCDNRCYCGVELLPDSVSTLLFSTAFYWPRLKSNNGAACMICGLLPGNVLLLMAIPIKVRLRRSRFTQFVKSATEVCALLLSVAGVWYRCDWLNIFSHFIRNICWPFWILLYWCLIIHWFIRSWSRSTVIVLSWWRRILSHTICLFSLDARKCLMRHQSRSIKHDPARLKLYSPHEHHYSM